MDGQLQGKAGQVCSLLNRRLEKRPQQGCALHKLALILQGRIVTAFHQPSHTSVISQPVQVHAAVLHQQELRQHGDIRRIFKGIPHLASRFQIILRRVQVGFALDYQGFAPGRYFLRVHTASYHHHISQGWMIARAVLVDIV